MSAVPFGRPVAAAGAAPGWCLRFLSGAMKGRTVMLRRGPNVLGSGSECDVMLPGGEALPRHLAITVGEVVVTLQSVGAASAHLNGEELKSQRRSVVAGDVVSVGSIDVQMDRSYASAEGDTRTDGEWADSILPGDGSLPQQPSRRPRRYPGGTVLCGGVLLALAALLGVAVVGGGDGAALSADVPKLAELEKALARYPEVEVVAAPGGQYHLRGFVESRERKAELQQAMQRHGRRVAVYVQAADDMLEQARRYIGDPSVSLSYAGRGRMVVSGTIENEAVRQKIRRLGDDLHPNVLVSDKLQFRPKPQADQDAEQRAQWAGWQALLPARMVSITQGGDGLRYIQLANGHRYYEGSLLRSGAELTRIGDDRLEISDAPGPRPQAP